MSTKMSRRGFLAAGSSAALAARVRAEGLSSPLEDGALMKPNILIIHGDQHRMECLGAYGNNEIRTPHIDGIAEDGVVFEQSFCPFPVCTPSRYSLLSGLYVHQHRGWDNHCTLPPGTPTFPSILRASGYRTKAVGKMHFTPTYLDVGFDEMELSEQDGPGRLDDDYHRELRAEGLIDAVDLMDQVQQYRKQAPPEYWATFGALLSDLPDAWHSTQWIGDRAVAALEGWTGGGNLLMAGFVKPHHPFDPPRDMAHAYEPGKLTLLPGWTPECFAHDLELHQGYFPHKDLTEAHIKRATAYYYATIEHMDLQVGRMLEVLRRKGLYEKTLIIYTSDHGEYMGYHHLLLKGNYLYDPLARVPLIIKAPGAPSPGRRKALVNNVDVTTTIIRAAGCEPAEAMSGRDLLSGFPEVPYVFSEARNGRQAMARSATGKLLLGDGAGISHFYDLERDPLEQVNRFESPACREEIDAMRQAILTWRPFENLPGTFLDENAPIINRPNVPDRHDDHRREMQEYFQSKMSAYLG